MIRTVIFDIGNVLMRFNWWEYILQDMDYETADICTDAIWRRGIWNELDRGALSLAEVMDRFCAVHPEHRAEILQALDGCGRACHKADYAIPWIRRLKAAGYRVLFLSNYSDWLIEKNRDCLDFLPELDGGVFSSHVKHIKPEREIYQIICDRYDLTPEDCLFIDDNVSNIAAAKEFGLHAIHFAGYEQTYPQIMEYLNAEGLPV